MNVNQAIEIAKEWVEENVSQLSGFCGAYIGGSLSRMKKDESFPTYKDVDIYTVISEGFKIAIPHPILIYKGIILERFFQSIEQYGSPESVLSDPLVITNFVNGNILFDPTGMLGKLQQTVAKEYPRRKWVQVRYESEKKTTLDFLEKLNHANSPNDMYDCISWVVFTLAGAIAMAFLRPPTVRRCLALTKWLLQSQGKTELHESILKVYGCANINREQAEFYLYECASAFDRAVEIKRSTVSWLADLFIHPDVRPYLVDGAQEMINEGNHREAMFWITFFHSLANAVLQNDAPNEEKLKYQSGFDRLLGELGFNNPRDWQSRSQLTKNVAEKVFQFVEEVIENNPDIKS